MRPTGIFASNTKVCLTKTPAYEKGKLKNTAALRVPQRTVRPEQIDFLTKHPSWTTFQKQTILIFQTN
jgi:hypothetical protein